MLCLLAACVFAAAQGHGSNKGFRFAGSDGGSLVQLALRPDVQKELALTEEQKAKLDDLESRMQAQVKADLEAMEKSGESDPDKMRSTIGATGDKFAGELPNVLSADQNKRLLGLMLQRAGYGAVLRKDIQEALGVTDEQRTAFAAANKALLASFDDMRTMKMSMEEMRKMSQDKVNERNAAIEKALTVEQRTKFEAMKGAPFEFEKN